MWVGAFGKGDSFAELAESHGGVIAEHTGLDMDQIEQTVAVHVREPGGSAARAEAARPSVATCTGRSRHRRLG